MRNTLRWRVGLPFALLLALAVAGLSLYFVDQARQTFENNLRASLTADAQLLAREAAPLLAETDGRVALSQTTGHYKQLLGYRATIIRRDGVVLADSDADPAFMDNHLSRPEVKSALEGQSASQIRFSATVRRNFMYTAVPIVSGDQVIGAARLAVSLEQLDAIPGQIRRTVVPVTLLLILVTLLLAAGITETLFRPLRALTAAVQQFAAGRPHVTLPPSSPDEFGRLNQAFNQMAVELRARLDALAAERGKLAAVLRYMSDGVMIVDDQGIVQLINPAAEQLFNAPDNTEGRSLVEVARHHQLVDLWAASSQSGEQRATPLEISAERLYLQCVATPLSPTLPGSTLLLVQDLTRLRRLETVRQDFISNVSHELRTPLAAIKAVSETLSEGALEDPPAARHFLGRMEAEIDTLSQMVQELLELSRIESGRVPLQRREIAPLALLADATDRMRLQSERSGLTLRLDCPSDLPPVSVDPDRIGQVLSNLLHNAIKFTPSGGEVVVSAAQDADQIIFKVRDTGAGIPEKDLPRIFERFYKTDRARSGGGTGLGLSIARHIVEAHGGRIWAESTPDRGSEFFFSLPVSSTSFPGADPRQEFTSRLG